MKIIGTRPNGYDGFGQRLNKKTLSSGDENENEGDFCKCAFAGLSRDTYLVPEPSSLRLRVGNWEVRGDWHENQIKCKSCTRVVMNFLKYILDGLTKLIEKFIHSCHVFDNKLYSNA